jgi:hypothetical protein
MKTLPVLLLITLLAACGPTTKPEPAGPPSAEPPAPRMILPPITNPTPSKPSLINDLTGKTTVDAGRRAAQSARESAALHNARNAEVMEE